MSACTASFALRQLSADCSTGLLRHLLHPSFSPLSTFNRLALYGRVVAAWEKTQARAMARSGTMTTAAPQNAKSGAPYGWDPDCCAQQYVRDCLHANSRARTLIDALEAKVGVISCLSTIFT